MKKNYLYFMGGAKRNNVPHFSGKAYRTDGKKGLSKEEQKAIDAKLLKEKNDRVDAIKAAQKAYDEFVPEDATQLKQQFELHKALLEAKAADMDAEGQLRMKEAIEAAVEEVKEATEEQFAKINADLAATVKANEILQVQVKQARFNATPEAKAKTFNDNLADAIEGAADMLKGLANGKGSFDETIELKDVGDMSITANFPGANPWIQDASQRMIVKPYNRVWLADLLPQGTTTSNSIIYPKENGGEGGAAVWTDQTANKAQMDFDLTSQTAFVKWIAGYVIVYREMLDDIPWLTSYLRSKMLISLKTAENGFVLNGTADTNPVDGLLDVATAYDGLMDGAIDRIIDASYGQIPEDTFDFYRGNLTILNPRDLVRIGLNKAGGSGEYDLPLGSVSYANGNLNIAGLETVATTGQTMGTFLSLDREATSFIRRLQPEIRVFEDATLAKKNQVMFRIEERATLVVFNDDAIVSGTLEFGS